jgi:hypothetical protein
MKISCVLFLFVSSIAVGDSMTFTDRNTPLFGVVPKGGGKKAAAPTEDEEFERASKAILSGIASVEGQVQKAVEAEVETLFHKMESADPAKKAAVHEKAKKAVKKGVTKVKSHVDEHKQKRGDAAATATAATDVAFPFPYEIHNPYEWPAYKNRGNLQHGDSRILQAVEAAERAVLHAVEQEVETLFHETEHHDEEQKKQTEKAVKAGVKATKKKVQDTHEHRREWLIQEGEAARLEDYIRFAMD